MSMYILASYICIHIYIYMYRHYYMDNCITSLVLTDSLTAHFISKKIVTFYFLQPLWSAPHCQQTITYLCIKILVDI
jgi:hypothetical protein